MSGKRLQQLRCLLWHKCISSQREIGAKILKWFLWIFVSVLLAGCEQSGGSFRFVDETHTLSASVDLSRITKTDPSTFSYNYISAQGERIALMHAELNPLSSKLSFSIEDSMLLDPDTISFPEQILSLGEPASVMKSGAFSKEILGTLRIEVRDMVVPNNHALISYSQFEVPIYRQSFMSAADSLQLDNTILFSKVGATRVRVFTENGKPLQGASVLPYIQGTTIIDGKEVPAWHNPIFRPIIEKTDASGYAMVSALADKSVFQIIAFAEGYCTYISPEKTFDEKVTLKNDIYLKECSAATKNVEFTASWDSSVKTYTDIQSGASRTVAYTNEEYLQVRVDSLSRMLRPMRISVFEVPNEKLAPCIYAGYPIEMPILTSAFTVKVPVQFLVDNCASNVKSATGRIQVQITSLPGSRDSSSDTFSVTLYGKKSIAIPAAVNASKITVLGPISQENMISGLKGAEFTLESPVYCVERRSLGIRIGTEAIIYAPCVNGKAIFKADDFSLPGKSTQIGQTTAFKLYLKDEYGNESPNDDSGEQINIKNAVFVDYGLPNVQDIKNRFPSFFGFAPKTMDSGLPDGALPTSTDPDVPKITSTVVLTNATLSNFIFRFESKASCATDGTSADGETFPRPGASIYAFAIAKDAESVLQKNALQVCQINDRPQNLALTSGDIFLPSIPGMDASFAIRLQDAAGHFSDPLTLTIPPCPANAETVETSPLTPVCWRP